MRKEILERRHARLLEKRAELEKMSAASESVDEVRSINSQIKDLNADIADVADELEAIKAEETRSADTVPANAVKVNGQFDTKASFKTEERAEDKLNSMEYRRAFMNYVQKGTPIPTEYRAGDVITTEDTGAAIPLTVMNEVINTVRKRYGNLYNKVRKMSIKGGVEFAVGALQATAKWINESTVSPRQKTAPLGKVQFSYHTCEIRIAQSFVSALVTLDAFEARIAEVIAIAYLQAMDEAIVKGTGDGMPTGIINDARVTNVIEMSASDINDWKAWRTNFFKMLPLGYRAGEFIFPLSTVDAYLETMSDANNNPVFRQATGLEVNDGDALNPNGRFFGRDISLVEPDILPDFDSAEIGDVVGIFWQPNEYAINENLGFTMRRYFDEETNEWVDKALAVVDGKVLNPTGFYLIKKKAE